MADEPTSPKPDDAAVKRHVDLVNVQRTVSAMLRAAVRAGIDYHCVLGGMEAAFLDLVVEFLQYSIQHGTGPRAAEAIRDLRRTTAPSLDAALAMVDDPIAQSRLVRGPDRPQ